MVYSLAKKQEIIERMKNEKIADIAKDTGISVSTLYNWKNKETKIEKQKDVNYEKGKKLFKLGQLSESKKYFWKSININGLKYVRSIMYIGKIYAKQEKNEEAEKQFKKCLEIDSKDTHALVELGRLYAKQEKNEGAEEQFKKCLQIDSTNTYALVELGRLYAKQEKNEEAEEQFKKCLEIDSKDAHALVELGKLYAKQEKNEEAEEQFKKCLQIDSNDIYALVELRKLYVKQERNEEAEEQFKKCLQIDSNDIYALVELGRLYAKQEKNEEAEKQFKKCLQIDSTNTYALVELGKLYAKQEKNEEAEKQFKKCLQIDSNDIHALVELGKLYAKQEKNEEAEEQFKKCLHIDPNNVYAKRELKSLKQRSTKETTKEPEKVLEIESKVNKESEIILGRIRERLYSETLSKVDIDELKEKLESIGKEENEKYYLALIAVYEKIGQKNNALQVIKRMKEEGIKNKKINLISEQLKSKKNALFDLGKWDEIIRWDIYSKAYLEQEMRKIAEQQNETKTTDTIEQKVGEQLKKAIDEICHKYYVGMQQTYGNEQKRQKCTEKFNKLQSILECSSENKRAKMELILVLINEGYSEVAKNEFKEDYSYISGLMQEYQQKKITANEVKDSIDEYAL